MAWTLHLLVWITVMTASAYKCKHTSYASSDSDSRHHYDYAGQEHVRIPETPAFERMNTRSVVSPPSYSSNVPDDVKSAQLRKGEPMQTRTDSESKVLSWKPYAESRRGQNNDKIVFPGPTSEEFKLEIPEHCRRLGICEDVPNYPTEQVTKIISELSDLDMFEGDKLDLPDVPDITQRVGPLEENIELCRFEPKVLYPKAAIDAFGQWHLVLNRDTDPVQGFNVEICQNMSAGDGQTSAFRITEGEWQDLTPCAGFAHFMKGYQGRCKQKYVYRNMHVLKNGTNEIVVKESLKVPSCCSCVARHIIN